MKMNKGNSVLVAYFLAQNVSLSRPSVHSEKPFPSLRVKGKGNIARINVRWEPMPFYRTRNYIEILPLLWGAFRFLYDEEGNLKREKVSNVFIPGYQIEVVEEEKQFIQENGSAFVFPTKIKPIFRPVVYVKFLEDLSPTETGKITNGRVLLGDDVLSSIPKELQKDIQPLPEAQGNPIEAWMVEQNYSFVYDPYLFILLTATKTKNQIWL